MKNLDFSFTKELKEPSSGIKVTNFSWLSSLRKDCLYNLFPNFFFVSLLISLLNFSSTQSNKQPGIIFWSDCTYFFSWKVIFLLFCYSTLLSSFSFRTGYHLNSIKFMGFLSTFFEIFSCECADCDIVSCKAVGTSTEEEGSQWSAA